jgi:trehalose-phosphatase
MIMDKLRILDQFWQRLAASEQALLLLDYDGTLAPFRIERDQAVPYPGIRDILTRIRCETATRLVVISGRAIDDLLPLLGLDPPPEIWGCHGWEHLEANGERPALELPAEAALGLQQAAVWVAEQGLDAFCEQKPVSVAIHWRGLPDTEAQRLREQAATGWAPLAAGYGLEIHPFDGGLELRCPGKDKGTALMEIIKGLEPDCPVAFLGDDLTDEDGFAVIDDRGLGILVRGEARPTRAHLQIAPPGELLEFLRNWREHAPRPGKGPSC